jgi:predicted dehydrogenase
MMRDLSTVKVLVAGSGSIGRRHMRNLRQLGVRFLAACDPDAERLRPAAEELKAETYADFGHALAGFRPDVVFVCTPPVLHVAQALAAVRAGAHVFVEKPLSDGMERTGELRDAAQQLRRIVQVGYNMRFHPGIRALKQIVDSGVIGRVLWAHAEVGQYLPDWRPWQDYRQSYTARRELGGGIILDASHEIDYVVWLMGKPVEVMCMAGRVSGLQVNVEDCATLLLRFASGTQADVHLDFIQRTASRSCKLAGELGTATWEANQVRVLRPGASPEITTLAENDDVTYVDEIVHFFDCIAEDRAPLVDLAQAARVIEICLQAKAMATSTAEVRS